MRNQIRLPLLICLFIFLGNILYAQDKKAKTSKKNIETVQFKISGMTCAEGCAKGIEGAVYRLKGVKSSKVDFDKDIATIIYDNTKTSKEEIKKAIESFNPGEAEDRKYQAEEIKNNTDEN